MFPKSIVASLLLLAACSSSSPSAEPTKVVLPVSKLELTVPAGQRWTAEATENGSVDEVTIREHGLALGHVDLELHPAESTADTDCAGYLLERRSLMTDKFGPAIRTASQPVYLPASWGHDAIEYVSDETSDGTHAWACTVLPKAVVRAKILSSSRALVGVKGVLEEVARVGAAIPLPNKGLDEFLAVHIGNLGIDVALNRPGVTWTSVEIPNSQGTILRHNGDNDRAVALVMFEGGKCNEMRDRPENHPVAYFPAGWVLTEEEKVEGGSRFAACLDFDKGALVAGTLASVKDLEPGSKFVKDMREALETISKEVTAKK